MKKQRLSTLFGSICLVLVLVAVSFVGGCTKEKSEIKIGVLLPFTGVYASLGQAMDWGMQVMLDEVEYTAGGREIIVIKGDTEANSETGLVKAQKLVESDQVDILFGVVSSGVAYAIRDYVDSSGVPLIIANAGAQGLTGEAGSKYIFRASFANGQYVGPLGPYAVEKLGLKNLIVMCPDYSAGHEKADEFIRLFTGAGGNVVKEVYPELGTQDFGPYLSGLTGVDADGVFAFFAGGDAIRFVKQYSDYGLKDTLPLIGDGSLTDELFLESEGDAAIGLITAVPYAPGIDTPENKKFVAAYTQYSGGSVPDAFAYQAYVAAAVIVKALEAADGNTDDTEALLSAIAAVQFVGPAGPFRFDGNRNVIFADYIRKVVKVDGQLENKVIDKIEDVAFPYQP